jgi:hypothetical protein
VFYNYSGFNLWALTAKRVVREGQLSGFTTEEPGVVVWNEDVFRTLPTTEDSMAAVGDPTGGYWVAWPGFDRIMLVHTDRGANRDQTIVLAQGFEAIEYHDATVALASSPAGPRRVAYSRPVTEGSFGGTKQVFVRVIGNSTAAPRFRAVRP